MEPSRTGVMTQEQRGRVAEALSLLLADSYTLYLKTQNFHWNVVGPQFLALHLLFEEQYSELALAVDQIAERVRSLGFPVIGTFEAFSRLTSIVFPDAMPSASDMVAQLRSDAETLAATAGAAFKIAEEAGDDVTAGLLLERMGVHQKAAWKLRSVAA